MSEKKMVNKLEVTVELDERWVDGMVERFLTWELPESVCSDTCATQGGMRGRIGTNLLTADEARQMVLHLLGVSP